MLWRNTAQGDKSVQVEQIGIDKESLAHLGSIGEAASLRHAAQLLNPAQVLARTSGRDSISVVDVNLVHELFHDAKYSARLLAEQADKYIS